MKTWMKTLWIAAACLCVWPAAQAASVRQDNAYQARQPAGVWIDVRSPEEFRAGHLPGALNITPQEIAAKITAVAPDKNRPVHLYCRSGRRAELARQTLLQMGYRHVVNHGAYQDLLR